MAAWQSLEARERQESQYAARRDGGLMGQMGGGAVDKKREYALALEQQVAAKKVRASFLARSARPLV